MSKTTSVALGDHFTAFVAGQVGTGRYGSASEVLRAGLRLLEEREAKLEDLRAELRKGEESGDPIPFEPEKWLDEWHAEWVAHENRTAARRA